MFVKSAVLLLALLCSPDLCLGQWDQAELDLFDLVEEVGENFYDILHVDQVSLPNIYRTHIYLYPGWPDWYP